MRIPTLGALTLAAAAAVVAVPTTATAAAPTALADSATTNSLTAKVINVLANDTDADPGTTLTVTGQTNGAHGTASCTAAGDCTYTPAAAWAGVDTFTYTVSDGTNPVTGTVTVTTRVGSLVLTRSSGALTWPETLNLTGTAKDKNGAAIPNYTLSLMAKPFGGSYTQVGTTQTTTAAGKVFMNDVRPDTQTTYKWTHDVNTNSLTSTVSVSPVLSPVTYAPKSLALGDTTVVEGTATPVAEGATVELQKRNADGTWTMVDSWTFTAGSTATDVASGAAFSFDAPAITGVNIYRVELPVSAGRRATMSQQTTIKVYNAKILEAKPAAADEFVTVKNNGKVGLNLEDWVLSDADSTATLPAKKLGVGESVKIHSGNGTNNLRNIYLKGAKLWANDQGTIELTDKREFVVDSFGYGAAPVTP